MTEKRTKLPALLFSGVFFLLCAFFSLGMLIPGAADAADSGTMPSLVSDGKISATWRDDFEGWFSKHFAYRDYLVDAFSALKETVFCTGNDQVIVGRDGFLFSEATLDDYTGAAPMTQDELTAAADALENLRTYAEEHGASFLFLCAPNKNTIYGENMPARMTAAGADAPSNLTRLLPLLDERGVNYIDLRPLLEEAKADRLVYHRRDSHWNNEGARLAAAAAIGSLGAPLGDFLTTQLTETARDFRGDLDSQLYPKLPRYDEEYVLDLEGRYRYTTNYTGPMNLDIRTARDGGEALPYARVLVFRDSFANALIPYFAATFAEARFSRAVPYRIDDLEENDTQLVIVEIAERNLRTLIGADERVAGAD